MGISGNGSTGLTACHWRRKPQLYPSLPQLMLTAVAMIRKIVVQMRRNAVRTKKSAAKTSKKRQNQLNVARRKTTVARPWNVARRTSAAISVNNAPRELSVGLMLALVSVQRSTDKLCQYANQ